MSDDELHPIIKYPLYAVGGATAIALVGGLLGAAIIWNGGETIVDAVEASYKGLRRKKDDLTSTSWNDIPKEKQHPAIKLFTDKITAEKENREKSGENDMDHINMVYGRLMSAMGQINTKAWEAKGSDKSLEEMLESAYKTGAPKDRSNREIYRALDYFVQDIDIIMKNQEFPLESRSSGNPHDDNLGCFNPNSVADVLLNVTNAKVQAKLAGVKKYGVDTSDLGVNDIKPPVLPNDIDRACYGYEPFKWSIMKPSRSFLGPGMQ